MSEFDKNTFGNGLFGIDVTKKASPEFNKTENKTVQPVKQAEQSVNREHSVNSEKIVREASKLKSKESERVSEFDFSGDSFDLSKE